MYMYLVMFKVEVRNHLQMVLDKSPYDRSPFCSQLSIINMTSTNKGVY